MTTRPQISRFNRGPMASGRSRTVDPWEARSGAPSVRAKRPSSSRTGVRIGGVSRGSPGRRGCPLERGAWFRNRVGIQRADKSCAMASGSFFTRSKTVFTYAEGGGTLMHATYQVEWTGKSMLKSRSLFSYCAMTSVLGLEADDLVRPLQAPSTGRPRRGSKSGTTCSPRACASISRSIRTSSLRAAMTRISTVSRCWNVCCGFSC